MIDFDYSRANTVQGALGLARNADARYIAGGSNLVDLMKHGVLSPAKLIDINRLPLRDIAYADGTLTIGATALNGDVSAHPDVKRHFPLLAMAIESGASPQIRNMATTAGNLMQRTRCPYFYDTTMPCNKRNPGSGCGALGGYNRMHAIFGASEQCIAVHPSDMCVALAAYGADVVVSGARGERRIEFGDFHRLPGDKPQQDTNLRDGELITAVQLHAHPSGHNCHYLKVRDRSSYAFALVSVAAALEISGNTIRSARLAMGGVAHKPWRLPAVENFLAGKTLSNAVFGEAADIAVNGAKSYGANDYKIRLAHHSVMDALHRASEQA